MSGLEPFIVPSIVIVWKSCRWLYRRYKEKHPQATGSELGSILQSGAEDIADEWNNQADNLGESFVNGDGQIYLHNYLSTNL